MDKQFTIGTRCNHLCASLRAEALLIGIVLLLVGGLPANAQETHTKIAQRTMTASSELEWADRSELAVQDETPRLLPLTEYSVPALYRPISLSVEGVTVEEALKQVVGKADLRLSYGSETVSVEKAVALHYEQAPVRRVLQDIVRDTDLVLLLSRSGQLVVKERAALPMRGVQEAPMRAQVSPMKISPLQHLKLRLPVGSITGTVVESTSGEPLPGVNVVVEGTQQGASTDLDGRYEITGLEPGTYALRASFVGYQDQIREDVPVQDGEATNVDFVLEPATELLDEVVVVGYGSTTREDLTGSISSVSAADLENDISTTLDQALQGRVAGAMVVRNSGRPGGDVSIRIRGLSTLNTGSDEPLYVVDGVPLNGDSDNAITNPLATLNPQDIASIDILKDASAAAIYGSRASNGVVLITTKRGEAGTRQVDYSASAGMNQLTKRLDVMGLQQYASFVTTRADIVGYNNQPDLTNTELLGSGSDWQDALFRTAYTTDHSLAVSGGSEDTQYRISGGYTYQDGIAIESNFQRYSLRVNLDNQTTGWLEIGTSLNISRTHENISVTEDDLIITAIRQRPNVPIRTPQGGFGGPDQSEFQLNNPVGLAQLNTNEMMRSQAVGKVYANIDLLETLTLHNELNGTASYDNNYVFEPTWEFGARSNDQARSFRQSGQSTYWQIRNYLDYVGTFRDLEVGAMAGHEVQLSSWDGLSGDRQSFPSNAVRELPAGEAGTATNNSWAGSHSIESFFGRINLSYGDRYLLTTNFRADASSNFSPENRWGYFPSVSAAWRVTNEPFLDGWAMLDGVDEFKLRVGYGFVGNENIGGYRYGDTYTIIPTGFGSAVRASNIGNPSIRWESTESLNLGLDLSVLDSRVNLTVDAYRKRVKDLLLEVPLPLYAGMSGTGSVDTPLIDNIGTMENRGLEFSLNTVNLREGFQWESDIVFTLNRNEVVAMNDDDDVLDRSIGFFDTASRTVVGEPAAQFYGYVADGIYTSPEELQRAADSEVDSPHALPSGNSVANETGTWLGDLRFRDLNGDGVLDEQDRTFIGNPTPDFMYGITNRFNYKGVDLSVFVNGSYGNDIFNQVRRDTEDPAATQGMLANVFDYARIEKMIDINPDDPNLTEEELDELRDPSNYRVTNPETDMPRITDADPNGNQRVSSRFIEDGSYLRIQNVTLGYTLPANLTQRFKLRRLRVYGTVQNVYTFTGYSGYDPEVGAVMSGAARDTNQASDPLLRGIDVGRYPTPRTFTVGVNVGL